MSGAKYKISVGNLRKIIKEALEEEPVAKAEPASKTDRVPADIKKGDSRGDAIEALIAILTQMGAPLDYTLKNEKDPPDHHRPIATMLVDKVRQYTDKSVYRVRFKITNDSIRAVADDRAFAKLDLKDFQDYVRQAVKRATKEDPWGELVMEYDWTRIV